MQIYTPLNEQAARKMLLMIHSASSVVQSAMNTEFLFLIGIWN